MRRGRVRHVQRCTALHHFLIDWQRALRKQSSHTIEPGSQNLRAYSIAPLQSPNAYIQFQPRDDTYVLGRQRHTGRHDST